MPTEVDILRRRVGSGARPVSFELRSWIVGGLVCAVGLAACARPPLFVGGPLPNVRVTDYQPIHVVRQADDEDGLDGILAAMLTDMGMQVTWGGDSSIPDSTRATLQYRTRWDPLTHSNMTMVRLDLREAGTDRLLATSQTSYLIAQPPPPQSMMQGVLRRLLFGTDLR